MSTIFAVTLASAIFVLYNIYRYYFVYLPKPNVIDVIFVCLTAFLAIAALFTGQFLLFGSQLTVIIADIYFKFGLVDRWKKPAS